MTETGAEVDRVDAEEQLELTEQEQEDLDAAEAQAQFVSYSGQDFDVAGLIRRLENDDILIPSFGHADERIEAQGFQRSFVWNRPQMDRFIESLLLGYPIPGIFLVRQTDNRYLVLDGQQRLSTLRAFKEGLHNSREFALKNVADELKGLTYKTLPEDLRRKFDNTFIQAILVSSDGSPKSLDSVYNIFERLNSGGTQLTAHEIRVALYAGPFIDYIEGLNRFEAWRDLYGKRSPRLRDQELVLRILALFHSSKDYKRPLKKFLNDFVSAHRSADNLPLECLKTLFKKAASLMVEQSGRAAIRLRGNQVNAALTEAVFFGLMKRLDSDAPAPTAAEVDEVIESYKENEAIYEALTRSTADEDQVTKRLTAAVAAFMGD